MFGQFDLRSYLIRIFVLFLSISVHEWAHAYSAYRYGDDTAALQGRLTLNPLKHFEPIGLGLLLLGAPIAWAKPVPINPGRFRRGVNMKNATLVVSLSGIFCNLILAFIGSFLFYFTHYLMLVSNFGGNVLVVMQTLNQIALVLLLSNVFLAIFNLLPLPPLDGFELFSRLLPQRWVWWLESKAFIISSVMLLIIVFFRGPFSAFLNVIATPVLFVLQWPWVTLFNLLLR